MFARIAYLRTAMKRFETDEERKEYNRRQNEKQRENHRRWRLENREHLLAEKKLYYQEHKKDVLAKQKEFRDNNPDVIKGRKKSYYSTKPGLASRRVCNYRREDLKYGRETTVTREWIMDHIFSSSCVYCGESDWRKLGTDRKDNSIGHTPENCVPSCKRCNEKRRRKDFHQFINRPWYLLIKQNPQILLDKGVGDGGSAREPPIRVGRRP